MIHTPETKLIIVEKDAVLQRYSNQNWDAASSVYNFLEKQFGCTYLIYMYENFNTNDRHIYSSNWHWQDLLIGERLINHCPVFLATFKYLETISRGHILIPWNTALPTNKGQRNVCSLREDFNICHGIGYVRKGYGVRESIAFAGDRKNINFHQNFIKDPSILLRAVGKMRHGLLVKNHQNKIISDILTKMQ